MGGAVGAGPDAGSSEPKISSMGVGAATGAGGAGEGLAAAVRESKG